MGENKPHLKGVRIGERLTVPTRVRPRLTEDGLTSLDLEGVKTFEWNGKGWVEVQDGS